MTSAIQTLKKALFISILLSVATPIYATYAPDDVLNEVHGATTTPWLSGQNAALIDELQKDGVQVQVTDRLTAILRTDTLFRFPSNTRLLDNSRSALLYKVAQLVQNFGNHLITVSGHTDNVGSDTSKLRRSREQAETVAAFLWAQGIPLKNLLVIGCGDTEPVASNATLDGSAANRRIEIEIQ